MSNNKDICFLKISHLDVSIIRKKVKHLYITVLPPDGKVRITAPEILNDEAIRLAIISKLHWIKKQKKNFQQQVREPVRKFIAGETHYYLGKPYLLKIEVTNYKSYIQIRNKNTINLFINKNLTHQTKEALLETWYRLELKKLIPAIIQKWEKKTRLSVHNWRVRRMKTKWGSSNPDQKTICLNLELAKKPIRCLEYVIVHEMTHFIERTHNKIFSTYMDKFIPDWRICREELNKFPLADEHWKF